MASNGSPASRKRIYIAGLLSGLSLAAGTFLVTTYRRPVDDPAPRAPGEARGAAGALRAVVVQARNGPSLRTLEVQGEARPYASVTLYAKVSGYLREVRVERGDRVVRNEVLAVIELPEVERQREGARADARFKRENARRAAALTGRGAIASEEVEAVQAAADMADAVLAGLDAQKEYAILKAPFAGTVTARYADPGALVQNAGSARSGALPVVTIGQTDRLRIQAHVDQRYARLVRVGSAAEVSTPESGATFRSEVSRTSGELDPRTRTMFVELELENEAGTIVPGSFVRLRLQVNAPSLVDVPAEALLLRDNRPHVAVVTTARRIALRPVSIGVHAGDLVGIRSGLADGEKVALGLGPAAVDGMPIEVVVPPGSSGSGPPAAKQADARTLTRPAPDARLADAEDTIVSLAVVGVAEDDVLNVRVAPDARSEIVGTIPPDARGILPLGPAKPRGSTAWQEVVYEDLRGWVNARFLQPTDAVNLRGDGARVRPRAPLREGDGGLRPDKDRLVRGWQPAPLGRLSSREQQRSRPTAP